VLLASLACNEDSLVPPFCPPYRIGALEGYVRAGGEALVARVGARQAQPPYLVLFETRSDSAGWYHFQLSPGLYSIELDPDPGSIRFPLRDTVRVTTATRRLDIRRGKLTVRVATPPALEGADFWCDLDPLTSYVHSSQARAVASDGTLEFAFPSLGPGTYRISLWHEARFWLPGTYDVQAADRVVVPVDRPVVYEAAVDRYASITGTVRGSWQEAQKPGPTVAAYRPDRQRIGRATTAQDGSFALDILVAEPVRLQVESDGITQWVGGDSFESATVFDLQPGDAVRDVPVVESGILCRIELPGFLSSHDAAILLRDESGNTYRPSVWGRNPVAICNLRPGRYFLFVYGYCDYDGEPWASQWYDGADSLAAATPIELPEGQLVPITVHLALGGAIEGRVLASDGTVFPGASVAAFDQAGAPLCDAWRGFPGGSFALRGLGNGRYYVATRAGTNHWWYPGTAVFDSARAIEIRDHATVTGIEWRLPPAQAEASP
jgi:hypothetical protein